LYWYITKRGKFTRPSPASVLQATKRWVRRPGYEDMIVACVLFPTSIAHLVLQRTVAAQEHVS